MTIEFPPPPQGASNAVRAGTGFKQWFLDVWSVLASIRDTIQGVEATVAALGTWQTYTPTSSGLTLGTGGTLTGRYTKVGRMVTCNVQVVLGTGGLLSSTITLGVPVSARTGYNMSTYSANAVGGWGGNDSSATGNPARYGGRVSLDSVDRVRLWGWAGEAVSAAFPWTWAANDVIECQFTYESAA